MCTAGEADAGRVIKEHQGIQASQVSRSRRSYHATSQQIREKGEKFESNKAGRYGGAVRYG